MFDVVKFEGNQRSSYKLRSFVIDKGQTAGSASFNEMLFKLRIPRKQNGAKMISEAAYSLTNGLNGKFAGFIEWFGYTVSAIPNERTPCITTNRKILCIISPLVTYIFFYVGIPIAAQEAMLKQVIRKTKMYIQAYASFLTASRRALPHPSLPCEAYENAAFTSRRFRHVVRLCCALL